MNESAFTACVGKEVVREDPSILAHKISNPLDSGWPDVEYISTRRTLYVEYKMLKRKGPPKSIRPDLSEQQKLRCAAIYARQPENMKVVVVVELARASYMVYVFDTPAQWESTTETNNLMQFDSRPGFVHWLVSYCNHTA